ncbi:hypothetical protein RSAG8_04384, partial [Rhizoctonia solani AG-8 WAC10335]
MWHKSNQESGNESGNSRNQDNNNNNDDEGGEADNETERHEDDTQLLVWSIRIEMLNVRVVFSLQKLMRILLGIVDIIQLHRILRIEKTIAVNNVTIESGTWSFGQITAFAGAMAQAIYSLYSLILKWRTGKGKRKDPRSGIRGRRVGFAHGVARIAEGGRSLAR